MNEPADCGGSVIMCALQHLKVVLTHQLPKTKSEADVCIVTRLYRSPPHLAKQISWLEYIRIHSPFSLAFPNLKVRISPSARETASSLGAVLSYGGPLTRFVLNFSWLSFLVCVLKVVQACCVGATGIAWPTLLRLRCLLLVHHTSI